MKLKTQKGGEKNMDNLHSTHKGKVVANSCEVCGRTYGLQIAGGFRKKEYLNKKYSPNRLADLS